MTGDHWFRVEDRLVSGGGFDVHGDYQPGSSRVTVVVVKFPVVKYTPKGAWLRVGGERRFVLREVRRRFAAPTMELATESFIARKKKQASIYETRVKHARRAIQMAESGRITETFFGGVFLEL